MKENNTVYRNERQAIQDLRDALQSRAQEIEGLASGGKVNFVWKTAAPRLGYNSVLGGTPTEVTFSKVTGVVFRMQDGRLHVTHFSPSM